MQVYLGMSVMNKNFLKIILAGLPLFACQTLDTPKPETSAKSQLADGMIRAYKGGCMKKMAEKSPEKKAKVTEMLARNNMTVGSYCECIGETIFRPMSDDQIMLLMKDVIANKKKNVTANPLKGKAFEASLRCAFGARPAGAGI
jgi:hypothetical protein